MMERISFRWGIPELDHGNVVIPEPIYRYAAKLGVKGSAFVLIVQLAAFKFESEGSVASPSYETLAERIGVSRRRVMELVDKLESDGWLVVKRRGTQTNEYNFEPLAKACWELYRNAVSAENFTSASVSGGAENFTSTSAESRTTLVRKTSPEEKEEKNKKTKNNSCATSPREEKPKKKPTVKRHIMTQMTEAYRQLKGVEPKSGEWKIIQREFKNMILDGNHQHDIIAVMEWAAENDFEWSMHTVRKWLPTQRAGKLGRNGGRAGREQEAAALRESIARAKSRHGDMVARLVELDGPSRDEAEMEEYQQLARDSVALASQIRGWERELREVER